MSIFKKTVVMIVIISLMSFVTVNPALYAADIIPIKQLGEVEKVLYGNRTDKSLIERIKGIEETLYGEYQDGTLVGRSNKIIEDVLKSRKSPSLLFIINSLEWSLTNNIGQGNITTRLNSLENIIYGESQDGAVLNRIDKMVKMSLPEGNVPVAEVELPADTLIRIKLLNKISSVSSQTGENINFEVARDVEINNKLVIPEGTKGSLRIAEVDQAGQMGQDGEVKLKFSSLRSIDGTNLSIDIREKAQEENRSQQLAIGASIIGTIILGPVGLITGYFVKGNEKDIPAGSEIYVQTKTTKSVYGLKIHN